MNEREKTIRLWFDMWLYQKENQTIVEWYFKNEKANEYGNVLYKN